MSRKTVNKMTWTALLSALCYIGFQFLKIDIPLPGGTTAVHFGNTFCVLGALLLGGTYGGLAGAIGMTLADLMNPLYVVSAPKTFFLKFMIGLITGLVAHQIGKINEKTTKKDIAKWATLGSTAGMLFNVIFDPLISYLYKRFLLGVEASTAQIFAAWAAGATFFNAITSIVIASILYLALRPHFKKLLK